MQVTLGVVMDPIETITPRKDTTLAMLLAGQRRGWALRVIDQKDLWMRDGKVHARYRTIEVRDDDDDWFSVLDEGDAPLAECHIVLMRKDPPFDMHYIYSTYLLEHAAAAGVLVSNRPASLRDVNEKLFTAWFPEHCPTTLVSASSARLREFIIEHDDVIIKPLDGMGGTGIFRLTPDDPNLNIILEQSTMGDSLQIMAQRFLPEISEGDKRILVVDGKVVPFALARIPAAGETRGNLAAGGRGVPVALSDANRRVAEALAPELVRRGLLFVGLDMIGNKLTEINVTSPTCVRELDAHMQALPQNEGGSRNGSRDGSRDGSRNSIADDYLGALESRLESRCD
ncbi:MAG: glutathione synthase [Gammaproteobacteria bacterium]|nr:MAG: glutathione synthase [Gammaproteobacteria bacterium]